MNDPTNLNSNLDALLKSGANESQVWMLADWLIRGQLPLCLDIAGMDDIASRLRVAQPIADFTSVAMVSETIKKAHQKLYADVQRRSLTAAKIAADEAVEHAMKEMASNFTPIVGEPNSTERNVVIAVFVNDVHSATRWSLWLAAYKAAENNPSQLNAAQIALQPVIAKVKESGHELVGRISALSIFGGNAARND